MSFKFETFLVIVIALVKLSVQHGSMIEPPSRTNAWLYDKDFNSCCKNYDYNQMNCGGQNKLWTINEGKCGICGESWDEPKNFEKGGKKYLGKIVKTYRKDSVINVTIQLTANHKGYFEFRLCNLDGWESDATEQCLNKTLLRAENSLEDKHHITTNESVATLSYNLKLPSNLTCNHCLLQWHWVTANYWGKTDSKECLGCGILQEHSNGCSDIAIKDQSNLLTTLTISSTKAPKSTVDFGHTTAISVATSTATQTTTSSTTTTTATSSTSTNLVTSQGCQAKLEFGQTIPSVRKAVNSFCTEVCHSKCLNLISDYEKELYINSLTEPTPDLLTCLDTCPVLCTCHTARIP